MRVALSLAAAVALTAAEPLALRDGDRVVLLGGTLIEREQQTGHWETALTAAAPRGVTFRNLGWSGDTVWGESRAGFGSPADGFKRLVEQVTAAKPTVLVVAYGTNEAFAGPAGVSRFADGLAKLLDALAPLKARAVLLSPPPMEKLGPPLPDPAKYNADLPLYRDAIRAAAGRRGYGFVDLAAVWPSGGPPLTDNGLHPTPDGYRRTAPAVLRGLGLPAPSQAANAEALRRLVVEKNQLFFHRWRPQNETYLFGFRKHEQGKNAAEVPQFDPLVAAKEAEIAGLRTSPPTNPANGN